MAFAIFVGPLIFVGLEHLPTLPKLQPWPNLKTKCVALENTVTQLSNDSDTLQVTVTRFSTRMCHYSAIYLIYVNRCILLT